MENLRYHRSAQEKRSLPGGGNLLRLRQNVTILAISFEELECGMFGPLLVREVAVKSVHGLGGHLSDLCHDVLPGWLDFCLAFLEDLQKEAAVCALDMYSAGTFNITIYF